MRRRMITPSFYSDDKIMELSDRAKLMFIGLWNFSDDSGIHKNNIKVIKAEIFPGESEKADKFQKYLDELLSIGLLEISKCKGFLKVRNWNLYQTINRPTPSKYEGIEFGDFSSTKEGLTEDSVNTHGGLTDDSLPKEVKLSNLKEVKRSKAQISNSDETEFSFESFYSLYPVKKSKQVAKQRFNKLSKPDKVKCIEGLNKYLLYWQKTDTGLEYIPHPSTFISQRRFEDEIEMPSTKDERLVRQNDMNVRRQSERMKEYFKDAEKDALPPEQSKIEVQNILSNLKQRFTNEK